MKVIRNEAWAAFFAALEDDARGGVRLKDVRDGALHPGGRARLTLFERVAGDRPHPRLRVEMPPARDPAPPAPLFEVGPAIPADAAAFAAQVEAALTGVAATLAAEDLDPAQAPAGSPRYWRNSIRTQRIERFFAEAAAALARCAAEGAWAAAEVTAARAALRARADEVYAVDLRFDDADTGTYHSFGHDAPFVHCLEAILAALPAEGTRAYAVLPPEQQASVLRQRDQARHHLDHLMRHKYAYDGIRETDIELSLGGLLIDRERRQIVSEAPASKDSLVPRYELLRIAPGATHLHAGAWIYRHGDTLRLADGAVVEVDPADLRATPVDAADLTFRRAPHDPQRRPGVRFDWDGNGYVQAGRVEWVSWAGHCDIKAIEEQLGITLHDGETVTEFRSDSRTTTTYGRDLLLEMVTAIMELGSLYVRADGSGVLQRGVHLFGGARNDSRPDRLQFQGPGPGRSFRWPLGGRQESFVVVGLTGPDGAKIDLDRAFFRHVVDPTALTMAPNPRYLKTVEGDYNLIDVAGCLIEADVKIDAIDETTGYPTERRERVVVDLRPEAERKRWFLGTWMDDPGARRLYRVYLDRADEAIIAELDAYDLVEGRWTARNVPEETVRLPLVQPLGCTLSREMKRDDPAVYQTLLDEALRHGRNICADTDMRGPVWNGVVTRLHARKLGTNPATRVERWRVDLEARFGSATLDYLLRRDDRGEPVEYAPVPGEDAHGAWPDFLWADYPDVGSKGMEGADWVINRTMLDRGIVTRRYDPSVQGGVYVEDDHVKNLFEVVYAGLAGYRWTVVHNNKRFGFTDEAAWQAAVARLEQLAEKLELDGDAALN